MISWLENRSDWLSPIVVKEVRQVVRGREFNYSFGISLVAGLAVAFFGSADALTGSGTSGNATFMALMGCLTLLGLAVVPLGAFNALRNERMEQTLELITLTALSPRRVVIGKLLAQGVKLGTLFAAIAPFIAMSFLLGGIDFVTILVSLLVLFMWSLWASAAGLFLSSLLKSRAMSALVYGAVGIGIFFVMGAARMLYFSLFRGFPGGVGVVPFFIAPGAMGTQAWWALAVMTTFWMVSITNLVFLAENRLALPTENKVTSLRVGFLVQFLLIAGWMLTFIDDPANVRSSAIKAFGVLGGLHLAIVAMFTVTEDLALPRRTLLQIASSPRWRWLLALFRPGRWARRGLCAGTDGHPIGHGRPVRGVSSGRSMAAGDMRVHLLFFGRSRRWCCRALKPLGVRTLYVRVAVLVLLPASMLLPDLVYYVLWRPEVLDLTYSARHLLNPIRTLSNWDVVETRHWHAVPSLLGFVGLLSYSR